MTRVLVLLLLAQTADFEAALKKGNYQVAVANAPSAEALMKATIALKDRAYASGVVQEVVHLRGVLRNPEQAAAWMERLASRHPPIRDDALASAGYLYLRAQDPPKAIAVLLKAKKTGLALTYLGDAYRRNGDNKSAHKTLMLAAKKKDAPQRYLQDAALSVAARLRTAKDDRYPDLLAAVGLSMKAGVWLKEDADYELVQKRATKLRKKALTVFRKGLKKDSPAVAYWEAAGLAKGNERTKWLVEAVQNGVDPTNPEAHTTPAALLDLAWECALKKRYVAALSLAQRRLRVGPCEAAWQLIESIPPQTRAP